MAIDATKILMLGGLAVAGYFVMSKLGTRTAAVEMGQQLEDLTDRDVAEAYDAAEQTHQAKLAPIVTSSGHLLFEPLDLSAQNPLAGFDAVVKNMQKSWWDLYAENGSKGPKPLGASGGFNYTKKYPIARVFFFNRATGREVAAYELKQNADLWLPDMQSALQLTFAHAFNHACKVQPAYRQWTNELAVRYPSNKNWSFDNLNCDRQYPVGM